MADGRIGTFIKNKWRIDARLGSGGMATVYAATHRNGNRVALKILRGVYSRDPEVRDRFLREGYAANTVGHPGVVKILDDDVDDDGSAFLVMELLDGESLEARRKRLGGTLPEGEVFTVGEQLLDLLAAAHAKNVVHRDIKPDNVVITRRGEIKLLDFGVARLRRAGGSVTGTGLMLGTPDFMSPEQAGGHSDDVDGRTDIWAVGAMMFMLLSGETVHVTDSLRDHIIATSTRQVRSLAAAAPSVAPELVAVIDRALKLDKNERWPDARSMQQALRIAYRTIAERGLDDDDEPEEDTVYAPMMFSDIPSADEPPPPPPTERLPLLVDPEEGIVERTKLLEAPVPRRQTPPPRRQTLDAHATEMRDLTASRRRSDRLLLGVVFVLLPIAIFLGVRLAVDVHNEHRAAAAQTAKPVPSVPSVAPPAVSVDPAIPEPEALPPPREPDPPAPPPPAPRPARRAKPRPAQAADPAPSADPAADAGAPAPAQDPPLDLNDFGDSRT